MNEFSDQSNPEAWNHKRRRIIGLGDDSVRKNYYVELKRQVAELELERQRYEAIFNSSNDAIFIHDAHTGQVLDVNQRALEMLGCSAEEVLCRTISDFCSGEPPYTAEGALRYIQKCVAVGPQIFEWQARRKNGEFFWVEMSLTYAEIGSDAWVVAAARDISMHKRSDQQLRLLLQGTSQVTGQSFLNEMVRRLSVEFEVRVVFVGQLLESGDRIKSVAVSNFGKELDGVEYEIAGMPSEELISGKVLEIPDRFQDRYPDVWMAKGMGIMSYFGVPVYDGGGHPMGVLAFMDDVPFSPEALALMKSVVEPFAERAGAELRRIRAERALLLSEEQFRKVVTSSPVSMYIFRMDEAGRLVVDSSNPAADEMKVAAIDSAHLAGNVIEDVLPGLAGSNIPERFLDVVRSGEHCRINKFFYLHDGAERVYDICAFSIGGERLAATFEDVTEACLMQEKLHQSQKMESIGKLAGGIAHDFNNVLGAIMGGAELLQYELEDGGAEYSRHNIDLILNSTRRAADLTKQLLVFSRKQTTQHVAVEVNELVNGVIQILSHTLDPRIELSVDLFGDDLMVEADASQIQNAILNLAINARDAMPDGGALRVKTKPVWLDQESKAFCFGNISPGEFVAVEVVDNGCGIAPDVLKKVFEPFFTTKAAGKGTGLGLSTVYGTVLGHGGAVHVYSEEGMGTRFVIYLPRIQEEESVRSVGNLPRMVPGQGTILFVDDEADIVGASCAILKALGYTVVSAVDGEDALEKFESGRFDAIVLDLIMPRKTGFEVVGEVRAQEPTIPVLLASGFTERLDDLDELQAQPGISFIQKPYSGSELSRALAELLKGREPG